MAMHVANMELAISAPQSTENIDSAVRSLRLVRSRLDEVLSDGKRSLLTKRAVTQVDILTMALAGIAEGQRGRLPLNKMQKFGRDAAATVGVVDLIAKRARSCVIGPLQPVDLTRQPGSRAVLSLRRW